MTFPAYPAYKESGVDWLGAVPENWDSKRMKFLFNLVKREIREEDRIVTCFRDGVVTLRDNRRTDGFTNALKEIGYQGIRTGDLVIHAMDAFAGAIGVSDSNGKSSPVYSVCTPASPFVSASYYARLLRNMAVAGFVSSLAKGIRERSTDFRWADASEIFLPVPPELEQRIIVNFLDHETVRIDALIEEQRRLVELLKEKRQAVISHTVTKGLDPTVPMKESGVEWLGHIPDTWKVIRLSQVIRTRKGFAFSASDFSDTGIPVVKASDIKNYSINEPTTFISQDFLRLAPNAVLKKGNVVLSTVGSIPDVKNSAVGQIGRVPDYLDSTLLNQNTVIFEPDESMLSSNYLFFLLLTNAYRDHLDLNAHGTANQASLSLSDMLDFLIPLPDLDEQQEIATELSTMIEAVKSLELESDNLVGLLAEHRSALISSAVTGKIDLRGWQPPASAPTPELALEAV